jgi:hypothetical protein
MRRVFLTPRSLARSYGRYAKRKWLSAVLFFLLVFLSANRIFTREVLPRDDLIADTRQLASTIEEVHPDPYINGGGKIAFHRRLQNILSAIPDRGMTAEEYYELICPFVTSVGDAHTWLKPPDEFDYGLPLFLSAVGSSLYVSILPKTTSRDLMGALLLEIEGVPTAELIGRADKFVSGENEFQIIRNLTGTGMLFNKWWIERLVPEWQGKNRINVTLQLTDGRETIRTLLRKVSWKSSDLVRFKSRIKRPSTDRSDFAYSFIDSAGSNAWLVIDDMMTYREAFEMWASFGHVDNDRQAAEIYRRFHTADAPDDRSELIGGLPAATDVFRSLVVDMEAAKTKNLFVDVRRNGGGNSAMSEILVYFLYGKEMLHGLKGRNVEIRKMSPTFFEHNNKIYLDSLNVGLPFALEEDDYDFSLDFGSGEAATEAEVAKMMETFASNMPTFHQEYESGRYSGYYLPENVIVLCSPQTFSAGYTLMYYLHQAGALIAGTPSAQAGNCFGDAMGFDLKHSGLHFTVSHKYFELFPGNEQKGRLLLPDYPMTYDILSKYDFDPNAEILYMLDRLQASSSE